MAFTSNKKTKPQQNTQCNKIVLLMGLATILLFTAGYQVATFASVANPDPEIVSKFRKELKQTEESRKVVQQHIEELKQAQTALKLKDMGKSSKTQADETALREAHNQIADLSQQIHDLQSKYVRLASEDAALQNKNDLEIQSNPSANAAVAINADISSSHRSVGTDDGVKDAAAALKSKFERVKQEKSNSRANNPLSSEAVGTNHGPGGKKHLIPTPNEGEKARDMANADPVRIFYTIFVKVLCMLVTRSFKQ